MINVNIYPPHTGGEGMLWLLSFFVAVFIGLLVRKYLPQNILTVYIKLISSSYLNIFIGLFIVFYVIMFLLFVCEIFTINIITEFNLPVWDTSILHIVNPDPHPSLPVGEGWCVSTVNNNGVVGSNHINPNNPDYPYGVGTSKTNFISNTTPTGAGSLDLSQFPLNLLPDLDVLSSCCLSFIFFLINIYTVRLIVSIDFSRYLPDNLIGRLLLKLINRYISAWSKMSNFFLVFGWTALLCTTLFIKYNLHYIVNF